MTLSEQVQEIINKHNLTGKMFTVAMREPEELNVSFSKYIEGDSTYFVGITDTYVRVVLEVEGKGEALRCLNFMTELIN